MNFRFWPGLALWGAILLIGVFLSGFFLADFQAKKQKRKSLKQSIKLKSLLLESQLNKRLDFLIQEITQIQKNQTISSKSPFFALMELGPSEQELILFSKELPPPFIQPKGSENLPQKPHQDQTNLNSPPVKPLQSVKPTNKHISKHKTPDQSDRLLLDRRRKKLLKFAQALISSKKIKGLNLPPSGSEKTPPKTNKKKTEPFIPKGSKNKLAFHLIKTEGQDPPFIVLSIQKTAKEKLILSFLKTQGETFHLLPFYFSSTKEISLPKEEKKLKDKKHSQKNQGALSLEGEALFHTKKTKLFKKALKQASALKFLRQSLAKLNKRKKNPEKYFFIKSACEKTTSLRQKILKKSCRKVRHLRKWERGGLFLIIEQSESPLLHLSFVKGQTPAFFFSLFLSILSLFLLCKKLWSILSAGRFLRFAFLSFDKTNQFPPEEGGKNPLLSFYNNRVSFLNRRVSKERQEIEEESERKKTSLNFLQILQEELDKLKSKVPGLAVREIYKFDARVFGFEKFSRIIIKELLSNGIEAMGGLKKPCLDLSVQKEGEELLFSVRDYGKGLSKKSSEKITNLYYSTKSQAGTGLNLVQSILKANGGEIKFENLEPLGLKVQVRLPLKCFLQNG